MGSSVSIFSLNPFILLSTFSYLWDLSGFHSEVTHTLQQQNPVNISKISHKKTPVHFHLVRELTQLNEYHSTNANKWVNSTDWVKEENENAAAYFAQLDCETILLATVRENHFTTYMPTVLQLRLFINRFHITTSNYRFGFFIAHNPSQNLRILSKRWFGVLNIFLLLRKKL